MPRKPASSPIPGRVKFSPTVWLILVACLVTMVALSA